MLVKLTPGRMKEARLAFSRKLKAELQTFIPFLEAENKLLNSFPCFNS